MVDLIVNFTYCQELLGFNQTNSLLQFKDFLKVITVFMETVDRSAIKYQFL